MALIGIWGIKQLPSPHDLYLMGITVVTTDRVFADGEPCHLPETVKHRISAFWKRLGTITTFLERLFKFASEKRKTVWVGGIVEGS